MITTQIFLTILIVHWFADYLVQDKNWVSNLSRSSSDLFLHTLAYSVTWMFGATLLFNTPCDSSFFGVCVNAMKIGAFVGITFIFHGLTDYITSRFINRTTKDNEPNEMNYGLSVLIGFDHVLHYIQLFITYSILAK